MANNLYSDGYLAWFDKQNVARPEHIAHVSEDDLPQKLRTLKPRTWRLEGNTLRGQTDMGELVQKIPTNYILTGTDEQGLPTFQKIVL